MESLPSPGASSFMGSLPPSLQSSLLSLVDRMNACGGGIQVVLLSTSEGVGLGRVLVEPHIIEDELLNNLESTWASPAKQFPLLEKGEVRTVTAYYNHLIVMQHLYFYNVLVVTLILQKDTNIGAIKSTMKPALSEILEPLCQTLVTSLSPESITGESTAAPPPSSSSMVAPGGGGGMLPPSTAGMPYGSGYYQ